MCTVTITHCVFILLPMYLSYWRWVRWVPQCPLTVLLFYAITLIEISHNRGHNLLQSAPSALGKSIPWTSSCQAANDKKATDYHFGCQAIKTWRRQWSRPVLSDKVRVRACVSLCVFDLWSRGHVSSVWIQLGCQEADKVSVVSRATGCDQLRASRAGRELCLCLFPATDGSVCSNRAFHNLLCPAQVVPAVVGKLFVGFLFDHLLRAGTLIWRCISVGKLQQSDCYRFSSRKILIQCLSPRQPFISALLAQSSVSLQTIPSLFGCLFMLSPTLGSPVLPPSAR